jgi:diguanylate cyclase (GGDEF)-like protein/hemerythrin-like metal-binding protein
MLLDTPPVPTLLTVLGIGLTLGAILGYRAGRQARSKTEPHPNLTVPAAAQLRALEASEQANAELRQALDQMEQAAGTDRLTGTWNRRRFEDGALLLIALSGRRDDPLSLILLDLDRFKVVNDTFGHGVGDLVLKSLVAIVREVLRDSDGLVRWGGEEFIVLCPGTTLAGATILAEKIRQAVEAQPFPQVGQVTISLGVAQHLAAESLDAWVARADGALYRAKERGRNCLEASLEFNESTAQETPSLLELVWDPTLTSGNPTIDHQHQQLYHLSNSLLATITSGRYPEDAKLQMQLLIAHVAQHFRDEEAILAGTDYPQLEAHAKEHNRLIAKAKELQRDMGGVTTDLPMLLSFLALDLVKGHLLAWDRRFFEHLVKG